MWFIVFGARRGKTSMWCFLFVATRNAVIFIAYSVSFYDYYRVFMQSIFSSMTLYLRNHYNNMKYNNIPQLKKEIELRLCAIQ